MYAVLLLVALLIQPHSIYAHNTQKQVKSWGERESIHSSRQDRREVGNKQQDKSCSDDYEQNRDRKYTNEKEIKPTLTPTIEVTPTATITPTVTPTLALTPTGTPFATPSATPSPTSSVTPLVVPTEIITTPTTEPFVTSYIQPNQVVEQEESWFRRVYNSIVETLQNLF